jgi:hypothetical protein
MVSPWKGGRLLAIGACLMDPPARAGHRVQVVLDDRRGHLRDVDPVV